MADEMKQVVRCNYCNDYEYFGEMRWLNGACMCRDCYGLAYERIYQKRYDYGDLDGFRPTKEEIWAAQAEARKQDAQWFPEDCAKTSKLLHDHYESKETDNHE